MDYHGLFFWCQIVNIDNLGRFNITVESASFSSLSALLAPKKGFPMASRNPGQAFRVAQHEHP